MFTRTLAVLALLVAPLLAQEAKDATPKMTQVALFKNGLAMIVTEVEVPEGTEWVRVRPLPAPMHGTFWVTSSADSVEMHEVVATKDEVDEQVDAMTVTEMLLANVGRDVVLTVDNEQYHGKLISVPQDPATPPESSDRFASPLPARANVLLIETDKGIVALDRASVKRVAFDAHDGKPATKWARKRQGASLLLHAKATQQGAKVVVSWLEHGLAWAPSYRMDVTQPDEGSLAATATIVNDLTDLSDTPTLLVSGFPNLSLSGVTSPLALSGNFDSFAQEINGASQPSMRRESMMTQQAMLSNSYQPEVRVAPGATTAMPGQAEEDMYFYDLGKVTLKRGQRASFPLFTAKTPYKDIYRWEIPDYVNQYDQYSYREREEKPEEVWHSLRMTNSLAMPWTTGPMLVTKDGKPLGQDTSYYTAPRATTLVKVTKALGVHAEQREYETHRTRDAERWGGNVYDRITIKGELVLTNFKDEKVEVEISKEVSGQVKATDPKADVSVLARGLRRLNPSNRLTWCVPIEAGKEAKLAYEYEVLVRQ